jgi:transcriptional regulator with XRE-family HTH domain
MEINDSIGWRLREERERLGFNQEDFAKIAASAGAKGTTRQSQSKYEKDLREPSSGYLRAIAKAGANVDYILTGNLPIAPSVYPTGGLQSNQVASQTYLSSREAALLDDFRSLSDAEKDAAETMLHAVAKSKKMKKA